MSAQPRPAAHTVARGHVRLDRPAIVPNDPAPPALRAELDALAEQMHAEAAPSPYAAERTPEQRRAVSGLARTW